MATTVKSMIQLGEPVERRGLVVAPLFPRCRPSAEYVTLEEAVPHGLRISEVDEAGSVPELLVENPLDANVLLYDGEEVTGAKQNRILNLTVLVGARSATKIPVSCVEQGRWSRQSRHFAPAPHASYPALRHRKALALEAAPMMRGAAQEVVWDEVSEKSTRNRVHSPTGAHADLFEARQEELAALRKVFPLQPGQSGSIFTTGGQFVLDYVSRPEAFALFYPKLLDGYLLDGIERLDGKPAGEEELESFLAATQEARRKRSPSAALGEDVRLNGAGIIGSGLELEGELIQLSAFAHN